MNTCIRIALGAVIGYLAMQLFLGVAFAAPLQPTTSCPPSQYRQHDMAGRYESSMMLLEMYPCGGSVIFWINSYGEHHAIYFTQERLPGGGVLAYGYMPDPDIQAYLDGRTTIAIKPAEVGWVQLITITDQGLIDRIYRLQKTE